MEYGNNIDPLEFTISCIVLIIYIWGKVWLYYKVEQNPNKENKNKKGGETNGQIKKNRKVFKGVGPNR